jgi:hypothetical protein
MQVNWAILFENKFIDLVPLINLLYMIRVRSIVFRYCYALTFYE